MRSVVTGIEMFKKTLDESDLIPGKLYYWGCPGNMGTILNISGVPITKVVIVTNCQVTIGANVQLQDVVIVTTNTSLQSITGSAGVILGLDDSCAEGGDVQLVTMGGILFTANLEMYGSQLLALRDIEFAARADGIEGAAMVAGGTISGTSLMNMAMCGTGMENNFVAQYFRMVE